MAKALQPGRALRILKALGPVDLRSVQRDPLLRLVLTLPLAQVLLLRFGVPYLAARIQAAYGFDLAPYYDWLTAVFALLVPLVTGVVIGFLLLDQRDDRTLSALQVTPLSLSGYLGYRLGMPLVVSLLLTVVVLWGGALVPLGALDIALIATAAAPTAPFMALFLAAFAANKVQGFALQKASGVFLMPPLMAYFLPAPWYWLLAVFPAFWPAALCWELLAGGPHAAFLFTGSLLYHGFWIILLLRRLLQRPTV